MECKICKKEFKNLGAHVRGSHQMGMEEYEVFEPEAEDLFSGDAPVAETVTPEEITERIFDDETEKVKQSLQDFLEEFHVTEKELRSVVTQYLGGESITMTQSVTKKLTAGKLTAESYLGKDNVNVTDLYVAEALSKDYGYKVLEVRSGPPKTWVLKR